jgi:hypothetical protein
MPVEVMLVAIAGMVTLVWIIRTSIRHEERKMELKAGGVRNDAVVDQLAGEVQRLRERVSVLEKLVTDDDRKLADEISRLSSRDTAQR